MMGSDLEVFAEKIRGLSVEQLLSLQEEIINELRAKTQKNNGTNKRKEAQSTQRVSGFYRPSTEEIEAELAEIFTPEELAEVEATDLSNLPQGPKSLSQIVNEDREDRV